MSRVVIITGASKGFGRALAERCHRQGDEVYGLSRTSCDAPFHQITCNVSSYESVRDAIAQVAQKCGAIDVLVCNAGYGISGAAENVSPRDAAQITDVNFLGVVYCVREALPLLRRSRGKILTVTSVAALLPLPFQAMYSATKAAAHYFTLALANEVRPFGVRACSVLPGDAQSSFTANRKKGASEGDYAQAAEASVSRMERDELGGMTSGYVAREIFRLMQRDPLPTMSIIGPKYKLLYGLSRLFPVAVVNRVIGKMYGNR